MSVFTNPTSSTKEETKAYVEAILGLLGDKNPVQVLERTESEIRKRIGGLSSKQLTQREAPTKWSIAHVVHHLADSDVVFGWRLRMIFAHDRPPLAGYDQDLWAARLGYGEADTEETIAEFGSARRANLRLLKRASPQDLRRVGIHAERGEESVAHLMKLYAGHDLLHLKQIDRVRAAVAGK